MKTAMQEAFDWLEDFGVVAPQHKKDELLAKEKEQIVNAYCSGGLAERFQEAGLENDRGAEEYYNKKFPSHINQSNE